MATPGVQAAPFAKIGWRAETAGPYCEGHEDILTWLSSRGKLASAPRCGRGRPRSVQVLPQFPSAHSKPICRACHERPAYALIRCRHGSRATLKPWLATENTEGTECQGEPLITGRVTARQEPRPTGRASVLASPIYLRLFVAFVLFCEIGPIWPPLSGLRRGRKSPNCSKRLGT